MKRVIFTMTLSTIVLGSSLNSCTTPAEKVEDAKGNVKDANEELDEANQAYLEDLANYRNETSARITMNEGRIAELKVYAAAEKGAVKVEHEKQIADLEKRNRDLKDKMTRYKGEGNEEWLAFKKEFNYEMEELGKALKEWTGTSSK
jgi:hypothetical protein